MPDDPTRSSPPSLRLAAPITAVTLFLDGWAEVRRELPLAPGPLPARVRIDGLPLGLEETSLRAGLRPAGARELPDEDLPWVQDVHLGLDAPGEAAGVPSEETLERLRGEDLPLAELVKRALEVINSS